MTRFGWVGGSNNFGEGINASGQLTGSMTIEETRAAHAFLTGANGGTLMDLGTLGGQDSRGLAVNDSGQVAGSSSTIGNGATHAFLSASNGGALADLGTLGGTNSFGTDVNNSGQVVGHASIIGDNAVRAFVSAPNGGALTDLGTLGGTNSWATAINEDGWVVGYSQIAGDGATHAFLVNGSGGQMIDLGTLGGVNSSAYDINGLGQIVGASNTSDGTFHAFIYSVSDETGMQDLTNMTDRGSSNLRLESGSGINDTGQIAGTAREDYPGATITHAVLLNPIPEPPNSPPTVTIQSPANDATFTAPATVVIGVDATDSDSSVERVDVYAGETLLGSDSSVPFEVTWSGAAAGSYSLTADAIDDLGATSTSAAVNIIVNPPPPTPSDLVARAMSSTRIRLRWVDNVNDETGFKIERSKNGKPFKEIGSVGPNVTRFASTDLQPGVKYFYRVQALRSAEISAFSNTAHARTLP